MKRARGNNILWSLHRHLFDCEAPETRGEQLFFRVFEGFVVTSSIALCWSWGWYTQRIEAVVHPLGLARYIDLSFLYDHGLSLLLAALVSVLCLAGFARVVPRFAYPAALLLFHLQYVARFSLGKVAHGSNFVGMSLLALTLAWVFFHEARLQRRFTFGFLYFFLGLGYVLAASCKLGGTGLTWPDGHHLWMWMMERKVDVLSTFGSFTPNPIQRFLLRYHAAATVVLAFGLITELLGWMMWWGPTRRFILLALVGLHVGTALTLNIYFTLYMIELLLLALPGAKIWDQGALFLGAVGHRKRVGAAYQRR